MMIPCEVCGKEFNKIIIHSSVKFCSTRCSNEYYGEDEKSLAEAAQSGSQTQRQEGAKTGEGTH